jgi:hypothetical protein
VLVSGQSYRYTSQKGTHIQHVVGWIKHLPSNLVLVLLWHPSRSLADETSASGLSTSNLFGQDLFRLDIFNRHGKIAATSQIVGDLEHVAFLQEKFLHGEVALRRLALHHLVVDGFGHRIKRSSIHLTKVRERLGVLKST